MEEVNDSNKNESLAGIKRSRRRNKDKDDNDQHEINMKSI